MMLRVFTLSLLAMAATARADNALYKCVDASGQVTYTNQKGSKGCTVLSRDLPVSTFTSPPAAKSRAATPADFPKVGNDQQKARDTDRRQILNQELATEQKNLDEAKKVLAEQENLILPEERIAGGGIQGGKREARIQTYRDRVQIHERNIEALNRELSNLR